MWAYLRSDQFLRSYYMLLFQLPSLPERLIARGLARTLAASGLGAAFKPNSDDLRDSPALDIAERIWARGADVVITDPAAGPALRVKRPNLQVVDDLDEALRDADLVLLLTEWREFVALDPVRTGELVRTRKIVDGRNVLDPNAWMNAGWTYRGMGRHGGPTTTAGW